MAGPLWFETEHFSAGKVKITSHLRHRWTVAPELRGMKYLQIAYM